MSNVNDDTRQPREVVTNRQAVKLEGTLLDVMSAHAMVTVYDRLEDPTSRERFESMGLGLLVDTCHKLVNR
jgi:hypothetical protein